MGSPPADSLSTPQLSGYVADKPEPPTPPFPPGFPFNHRHADDSDDYSDAPPLPSDVPDLPSDTALPQGAEAPDLPPTPPLPTNVPGVPSLPSTPSLPGGLPSTPSLPGGLPSTPSLPGGLPSTPSLPGASLPGGQALPSVPNLPAQLPGGLPQTPQLPAALPATPQLPGGLPQAPQLPAALPQAPQLPAAGQVPALPSSAQQLPVTGQQFPPLQGAQPQAAAPARQVQSKKIWLTGYSWQDNTPPGSSTVSLPVLHREAGGNGSYADPITAAVPGKGDGIWNKGARFYLPRIKRYVIVEDTGASKPPSGQDGHLDVWIDGQGGTKQATDQCEKKFTGTGVRAFYNPPPNLPVIYGPIYSGQRCNIPGRSQAPRP